MYASDRLASSSTAADGSAAADGQSLAALGWTQLAPSRAVGKRTTIPMSATGRSYRYYLIWITHLPPERMTAKISEVTLFR